MKKRLAEKLAPCFFLDAGHGEDQGTTADASPVSTGLGADYQFADHLTATLDGAAALRSVAATRAGRVTLTFTVRPGRKPPPSALP